MISPTIRFTWAALLALLIFADLAVPVHAQSLSTLRGFVDDAEGKAIANCRIVVVAQQGRYQTTSDTRGNFSLVLSAGVYQVEAAVAGYQTITGQVLSLTPGHETDIVVTLMRASASGLATLGHVAVNGTRALSTASAPAVELDPQDLAGQGVEQLSSILAEQVAITLTRQLGGAPGLPQSASIRGPDPSETVVDIDGHQVNNSNTGDFDLELLDPAQFSGVQVVYGIGPSSLSGANTQGGAINFRTLEPTREDKGLLRMSAGSFGTFAETAQATGTDQRFGYALFWHHFTTQGEIQDYPISAGSGIVTVGSGVDAIASLGKLRYSLANGTGFLELTYRNTTASRDLSAALSRPDNPANIAPGAPFTATNAPGAGVLSTAPAFGVDLQLPVGALNSAGGANATLIARHLTNVFNESTPNINPALNPYLIDQRDRVNDDSIEYDRYGADVTYTLEGDVRNEQLSAPAALAPGPPQQSQTQRSLVGRAVWSPTSHLHYTAATYVSRYDTFGSSVDPRVALVWSPTGNAVMRASVGTGFRAPLLTERAFNRMLTAERTTEYELGYAFHFGSADRPSTMELNAYRTNLRNPIFFNVDSSGSLTFLKNLGRVVYQGVELRYEAPLSKSTLLRATYGVDIAYPLDNPFAFDSAAPNVVASEQFQGIPPHKALIGVIHHSAGGLTAGLNASYESANNELNRPPYLLVDADIAKSFGRTQIALAGRNLTNAFDDKFTLPGAGVPYPVPGGNAATDAFSLQGRSISVTVTQQL